MRSIIFLFLLTIAGSLPHSIMAQCPQWNVSGEWIIQQQQTPVQFNLTQTGSLVTGKATYNGPFLNQGSGHYVSNLITGEVDGTAKGENFVVHVYWNNSTIGVYTGTISPTGKIEGDVYGEENPNVKVRWYSRTSMPCVKTIKTTGRPKVDPTPTPIAQLKITPTAPVTEDPPAATEPTTPMVRASSHSALIRTPRTEGKTTLTWNGGPLHRAAELWLKVDDGDETLVIASARGSLEATIVVGKVYLYMLKEAGKTLATDTVQFRQGGQVRPNNTSPPKEPKDSPTAVAGEAATTETSAPQISATPNNAAFVPGKIAHTVIRWDGGTDHPHAQLWVKVDDQEEKFVIEQGKGSRQMVVEPGKTYLYMVRDSGVRLATVTVKFHQ